LPRADDAWLTCHGNELTNISPDARGDAKEFKALQVLYYSEQFVTSSTVIDLQIQLLRCRFISMS